MRCLSRGFAICCVTFRRLVGWLALTAPLSKSLEPIAPPQITLLASDGTPIARTGAIVAAPVEAKKRPKPVTGAFQIGRLPYGESVCAYAYISGGRVSVKQNTVLTNT